MTPAHDPRGYCRAKEAAYLSVATRTIRYMVKRHQIPACRIGRLTFSKYSDMDEALTRYRTRAIGDEL
jgi:excisionase family DNA binding protein